MSKSALIAWIISEWENNKKEYSSSENKENREKIIIILAKQLREYINCCRTKLGVPEEQREFGQKMAVFLEKELLKRGWDNRGVSHSVLVNIGYARKHLGASVTQGSALKSGLSSVERKKLAKLTSRNSARSLKPKRAEDPDDADEL